MRNEREQRSRPSQRLELWGGVECTINRLGDTYIDQLELSGHLGRLDDLDRFARLGIRKLRYPVLWERTMPGEDLKLADWRWPDERLARLRELGIDPIVGLLHHGSGPRWTNLLDPEFPEKLAQYARAVAERYPWVEHYTPINEPLTTARFSALYGHWYPHSSNTRDFVWTLVNQCRATQLAMAEIRRVNTHAKLVQTEDLGTIYGTPRLNYQVEFENHRRWLTWDLLCGRVDKTHPLYGFLLRTGADEKHLAELSHHPCPPDIVGINHYVTSSRFLDDRVERYPSSVVGGNGCDRYVDLEAVRVEGLEVAPLERLLSETWQRYHIPLAVTEAHLACTREEQLRWLDEIWREASSARDRGIPVVAVTAWALLGSFDWDSLVTKPRGHYEPGLFDVTGGLPRPTALAELAGKLAQGEAYSFPGLDERGWWKRRASSGAAPSRAKPVVLITGGAGTLAREAARACEVRGLPYRLLERSAFDIANKEAVASLFADLRPWAVFNAAGYVRVDDAESDEARCFRANVTGPVTLAEACATWGAKLVTFSSDLVFDGQASLPYRERSPVAPLSVYGRTKAISEEAVLAVYPKALVVRTSAFFGPSDEFNFLTVALRRFRERKTVVAADDAVVSPTYVPQLANACLDLLFDGESGIWHLANRGEVSWASFGQMVAERLGLDRTLVVGRPLEALGLSAKRPRYSALSSDRGVLLPSLEAGIDRYLEHVSLE